MQIQVQLGIFFRQPVVKLAGERLRRVHDVGVELVLSGMEPFARVVEADSPEKILELGEEGLISYIKSIGLFRSKARHVMELSQILVRDFGGKIPRTREDLQKLPGVGRKTANVILNVVYGEPTMPVDTHLLRISPRMGLSNGTTPEAVEQDLIRVIPAEYMQHAHHWLILHGRYICTARNPQCENCPIADLCMHNNLTSQE